MVMRVCVEGRYRVALTFRSSSWILESIPPTYSVMIELVEKHGTTSPLRNACT
jgi:hypothetical protein